MSAWAQTATDLVVRAKELEKLPFMPELHIGLTWAAKPVQNRMQRDAPVRTGKLRANIVIVPGVDAHGFYVDIYTSVRAEDGFLYGVWQDFRRPYVKPAVRAI